MRGPYQSLAVVAVVLLAGSGAVITTPGLPALARSADTIALVRVVSAEQVMTEVDGTKERCGRRYTALVLDSIVGAQRGATIEFFSDYASPSDPEGEFFVMVRAKTPQARDRVVAAIAEDPPGRTREMEMCFARNEHTVKGTEESFMVAAEVDLSDRPGGPWFIRTKTNVLRRPEFDSVDVALDGNAAKAVSWQEVKRVFRSAILEVGRVPR
jgi:hypothetical protein